MNNKYIDTYIIINEFLILAIYKALHLELLLLLRSKLLRGYDG